MSNHEDYHCVKSVQIWSFFWSVLSAFGLNTERYSVSLRIQSQCRKKRTGKNSISGHFSRVRLFKVLQSDYGKFSGDAFADV